MRPGYCETHDEYTTSKVLLYEYLSSNACLSICGGNKQILNQIIDFLTRFVLPHEDLFVFFKRKKIHQFDEYNNCSHEGTNYGLKSHAAGVLPGHSIDNAAKCLTYQSTLKYAEIAKLASREFVSRELWSEMPSTEHLCMRAQALIASEWTMHLKFAVRRSFGADGNYHCWEVTRKEDKNFYKHSPIPRFQRIQNILLNEDGRLECDSHHFNRIGLPCRHIYTVICNECPLYTGPTQFDVSVVWWKSYFHLAYRKDGVVPESINHLFEYLSVKDVTGPVMPTSFNPSIKSEKLSESVDALFSCNCVVDSLSNYVSKIVNDTLQKWGVTQRANIAGRLFGDSALFNGMAQNNSINDLTNSSFCFIDTATEDNAANVLKRKKIDVRHREKLQSAVHEFLSVAKDSSDIDDTVEFLNCLYSNLREMTVQLRARSLQKNKQAKHSKDKNAGTTNGNGQRWVSLTQERDPKRGRQYVSNNGMHH